MARSGVHPLLAYAKHYLAHWPESEVKNFPGREEDAATAFFGAVDWFCEKNKDLPVVTFFSDTPAGMRPSYFVNADMERVYKL